MFSSIFHTVFLIAKFNRFQRTVKFTYVIITGGVEVPTLPLKLYFLALIAPELGQKSINKLVHKWQKKLEDYK